MSSRHSLVLNARSSKGGHLFWQEKKPARDQLNWSFHVKKNQHFFSKIETKKKYYISTTLRKSKMRDLNKTKMMSIIITTFIPCNLCSLKVDERNRCWMIISEKLSQNATKEYLPIVGITFFCTFSFAFLIFILCVRFCAFLLWIKYCSIFGSHQTEINFKKKKSKF